MRDTEKAGVGQDRLDELWQALEDGRVEDALALGDDLLDDFPEDGDVALARAAALSEAGYDSEALDEAERAGEGCSDDPLRRWYVAAACFHLWRFAEARELLDALVLEDEEFGDAWYLLAQVSDLQGDEVGARRGYDRSFALEPERFERPTRIGDDAMQSALAAARKALPKPFQQALDEVAVVIREIPTLEMVLDESSADQPLPPDILGLFVGVGRLDRSVFNAVEESGVIFLFKKNLEHVCGDQTALEDEVRTTLWHELAHYLGFEEEDMADLGLE